MYFHHYLTVLQWESVGLVLIEGLSCIFFLNEKGRLIDARHPIEKTFFLLCLCVVFWKLLFAFKSSAPYQLLFCCFQGYNYVVTIPLGATEVEIIQYGRSNNDVNFLGEYLHTK